MTASKKVSGAFSSIGERGQSRTSAEPSRNARESAEDLESIVYLKAGTGNLIARIPGEHLFHLGEQVTVQLDLDKVTLFEPGTEQVLR